MMDNCCYVEIDDDAPDFYQEKIVMARVEHKCCECHKVIKIGEKYHKVTGKWDGKMSVIETCFICSRIREDYCWNGFYFGALRDTLWECKGINYITGEVKKENTNGVPNVERIKNTTK